MSYIFGSSNWVIQGHMLVQAHVDSSYTFLAPFLFSICLDYLSVFSIGYPHIAMIFPYVSLTLPSFPLWLESPSLRPTGLIYLISSGIKHLECCFVAHLLFHF